MYPRLKNNDPSHTERAGGKRAARFYFWLGVSDLKRNRIFGPGLPGMALALGLALSLLMGADRGEAVSAFAGTGVSTEVQPAERLVVPVGKAVGIKLFSDGVLVVGLSSVETEDGAKAPGRDCGLKAGDVITHINGEEVSSIEQVRSVVEQSGEETLKLQAVRGQRQMQLAASAVENRQGDYQLGVWLRDSMAGIGTVTFYEPERGVFGALGHGINDVDTAMLMPLQSGSIMPANVWEVKKGEPGQPGELHGQFDLKRDLGTLYANTNFGIFGQMDGEDLTLERRAVPITSGSQVELGKATILSNIRGEQVEEFQVEITRLYDSGDGTRNLMLQVTDPRLLQATGGIVQGMSGSPIIQNGKLVGAVTHVLVNDPTRGYGIFIENMLNAAG